jgi:hypothetical protein
MARKTRRQKQRAAARQPALAQARPAVRPAPAAVGRALGPPTGGAERPAPAPPAALPGPQPAPSADGPAGAPAAGAEAPARRRVERIVPGAAATAAGNRQPRPAAPRPRSWNAAASIEPLDSDDPAIPFDRVPYVPADLRRVGMIAALMVVLILIAWVLVAHLTG